MTFGKQSKPTVDQPSSFSITRSTKAKRSSKECSYFCHNILRRFHGEYQITECTQLISRQRSSTVLCPTLIHAGLRGNKRLTFQRMSSNNVLLSCSSIFGLL